MHDFQNVGIFLQLAAMIILLLKIVCTLDCTGISGRTQILHALVFTTRFLDFPYEFWVSMPSFILKVVFLIVAYLTVAAIFVISRRTYEREHDTFRFDLLIGACTVLALLATHEHWEILSILWYLSVFLEAFAIFPQIHFTVRARYAGSSLVFYVGLLACYRAFYIVHWLYLFLSKGYIENCYVAASGCLQFAIYCGYFVWLLPIFKAQYHHLKEQQLTIVVAGLPVNGIEDGPKKSEALTND